VRAAARDRLARPNYDGWAIGTRPILAEPCRCERPYYCRDQAIGMIRCLQCGKRRPFNVEDFRIEQL
jgi:hypothetical protein